MKLETIYKKTKTGATQEWTIEVVGNKYRTHSGQVGGAITTNEWTIVYGKNVGKANGTTDSEQALKEADIKNKSKIVELQMAEKNNKISGMESDFLDQLTRELNAGQTGIQ